MTELFRENEPKRQKEGRRLIYPQKNLPSVQEKSIQEKSQNEKQSQPVAQAQKSARTNNLLPPKQNRLCW